MRKITLFLFFALISFFASAQFEAKVNFQNKASVPPDGYAIDYGKAFGDSQLSVDGLDYSYGWKKMSDGLPWDVSSDLVANGTGGTAGAGRNRVSSTYSSLPDSDKLKGTLVHFQGDNIGSWSAQPRGQEVYWELVVPDGIYEVTLGLGDADGNNLDSRHSATIEGYTVIPAFAPTAGQVEIGTIVVEVEDGALTMNGLGGFNSKITHIEIVASTDTPVNATLGFSPNSFEEVLEPGGTTTLQTSITGDGPTTIGLVIDDNINQTLTNDWLSLTESLGVVDVTLDATGFVNGNSESSSVIATAFGHEPAILNTTMEVVLTDFSHIENFDSYGLGNLHTVAPTIWEQQDGVAIPILGEGLTSGTTHALDFSNGGNTYNYLPLRENPIGLVANKPFYFATYFNVTGLSQRLRMALRIDDDVDQQWIREQVALDGANLIARLGLGGLASDNGVTSITAGETFQFVVKGVWDGANTISYEWTIDPKVNESETVWIASDTHNVVGTPQIGRLFISSVGNNDAKVGPIRLATDYSLVVTEQKAVPLSSENDIATFEFAAATGPAVIDTENHTVAIEVAAGTDITNLAPNFTVSEGATVSPDTGIEQDFTESVTYTVTSEDGTTQDWEISVTLPFVAHINFMSERLSNQNGDIIAAPSGYNKDFGQAFGTNTLADGSQYGWKNKATDLPYDISNLAADNSNGAGRNRIGSSYLTAELQDQLEGTLVHFQGDNVLNNDGAAQAWAGQPRGNEVYWELQVPSGTYEVTLGLGDKDANNTDSRHSATVEGYTVIPAFTTTTGEVKTGTIIVTVSDGLLTVNGLGGFNSKITHIDIVPSSGTPVNGELSFDATSISETLAPGASGTLSSILSGEGATEIGLVIEDNVNGTDKTITGSNDWLALPATNALGQFDFAMDATNLSDGATRSNTIIATAQGYKPAVLEVDLSVIAPAATAISAPFRMNVAGANYTKDSDLFVAEDVAYLEETLPTTVSITSYTPYTITGGHTDLYYPRRYGEAFSYNFPIENGNYTVALHMVENWQTESDIRVFDVTIEDILEIDDLDLFDIYGKGALGLQTFEVAVTDGELNIDFLASADNAIVQAIEILPVDTVSPCSPLSTLPCDQLVTSLPVNLDFSGDVPNTLLENGGFGTGFTVVLENSEDRVASDLPVSNPNVNGYEPSLLTLSGGTLAIESQAGIAFRKPGGSSNINNQINTLGVGLQNIASAITIKSKLLNINTGTGSAQAGLWFGYDEDNFVKLNVNNNNIELRVESDGFSGDGTTGPDQVQFDLSAAGNDVVLELVIDPIGLTAEAYHTIGANARALLGSLPIPADYFTGRNLDASGSLDNVSFAGIYASHRTGTQFTAVFEEFIVEEVSELSMESDIASFDFTEATGPAIIDTESHTVAIEVAAGTDITNLEPNFTVSSGATVSPDTGIAQDFTNPVSYTVTAEDGSQQEWLVSVTVGVTPCSPLSTLPCDQLAATLPLNLDFTAANGNLSDSGLTMVLEPSARLAVDDAVAHTDVPGYAPTLITQDANGLTVTSTKGIFYSQPSGGVSSSDTNSQMNAIGVGVTAASSLFNVSTTFTIPNLATSTGGDSQQAGIWYGLDEDHYIKLALVRSGSTSDSKVQLQVENMDNTTSATAFLEINTANIPSTTSEISLRMELDPVTNVVKGYYALDNGSEVLVVDVDDSSDFLPVPPSYFAGASFDSENASELLNFAGIYTTHRRADAGETFDTTFKSFAVEQEIVLASDTDVASFEIAGATAPATIDTENHTVSLEMPFGTDITNLTPNFTVSAGATVSPDTGIAQDFTNPVSYTVTAEDGSEQEWLVSVTVGVSPCSPLSTLPCDQLAATLPLNLDFTAANGNLSESGFTVVMEPSARLASDDALAHPDVPGYAPSLITQDANGLTVTSTKGIFYSQPSGGVSSSDTNSQMNALAVGLQAPNTIFSISGSMANPDLASSPSNDYQQTGIWYGLNEDYYIKLTVIRDGSTDAKRIQLHLEDMDQTTSETAFLEINTANIPSTTSEISLRMELDPVTNVVKGYYALDNGSEVLVVDVDDSSDFLPVPASYFTGTSYDTENPSELLNFAGIYTTHRRADAGETFDTTFKSFAIEQEIVLASDTDLATFDIAGATGPATIDTDNHTVSIEMPFGTDVTALTPNFTVSEGATVSPDTGVPQNFTDSITYTVIAEDGSTQDWEVSVAVAAGPCSPLSTLPCDQLAATLPLNLDFTTTNGNLSESGLTMVLEPSARLASDDALAHADVPGYAPSLIAQDASGLTFTSTKGIFYNQPSGTPSSNNTNSQMNALGTGLVVPNSTFSITTSLDSPDFSSTAGNSAQQSGIWFGLDEDHYMKLVVFKTGTSTRKVQLQVENMDNTTQETAFLELNTGSIGASDAISLRMEIDPVANTVKGYYTLDGGTETLVVDTNNSADFLPVPASYFTGTTYDTENPAEVLNFTGIFTTHRNAAEGESFTTTFKSFGIDAPAVTPTLSFDVAALNFSGVAGETIASQTAVLSANIGNPTIEFSDDSDASDWLFLPTNTTTGLVEFVIKPGVAPGTYNTVIFAQDQPEEGYEHASLSVNLEVLETANDFAVNINFSDPETPAPANYEKDSGDPFGPRGNGLNYGWLDANTDAPADLTLNGRNRGKGVSLLENTLIHMQYGDVSTNAANGYLPDAKWEIEVPNGSYLVTVFVGDPDVDGSIEDTPRHRVNAEDINIIDDFSPTGAEGSSTRFTSGSATVVVGDGRLTLDPSGFDGWNTKISSVQIVAVNGGVETPRVVGVTPANGAINVALSPTISANELYMPNFDDLGNAGVEGSSITTSTVKLFKEGASTPIGNYTVNGTGGGDAINLVPGLPLEPNTTYKFVIDGVLDLVGEPFEYFESTFTTGSGGGTTPTTDLDNVSFTKAGSVATGAKYATLTIGPDGKLYGLQIGGTIDRWTINSDGTLSGKQSLNTLNTVYGSRTSVGLTFDPDATANNLIAYVSHDSGGLSNAPAWDGKISRLSGANLEQEDLIVTNLPRSKKDHLTNSIAFRPGEPNVLYFNQGSNSAAGAPDGAWGNRKERLLSAAALRLDLDKLPEGQWPLNAKTTMDPVAINSVNVNSPTLVSTVGTYTEDGQTYQDDGTYNPYYFNAPLTLFATGVRNAYDLVWHSNGQLYIPTNGTAGGSNAPASIDGTRRPDGTFYEHSNPLYPSIPASNNNNVQRDWLFRIDPNTDLGYYGHPNPLRGEFVLNRGDADVNNGVYNGVQADENYRGDAFDFELNKSPNGVIEYRSNAENGNLTGAMLVVRYSGGSDIIALVPDGPSGDILTYKEGIPGFTGFGDPLDLVEDVNTGNIYVSDYARNEIVLLKPSNQAAPKPLIVLGVDEVVGDVVASSGTYEQEITLANLGNANLNDISFDITGSDSDAFTVVGLPASVGTQSSGSFTVTFDPASVGTMFANLTISGTDADPVTIPLRGLGKQGTGGPNEPSLQWILDTHLGAGAVNVGDTNPATNIFDGGPYNSLYGAEVDVQAFERATDAPVTLEVLAVYGPEANDPIVGFGWYETGSAASTNEVFTVSNNTAGNGQTLNPIVSGNLEFDPGTASFGFYNRWPFFSNRHLYSEDALNTFSGAIPHHVRVYELPGEDNAYIIATEEHISGYDYQDVVVVARNIRPYNSVDPAVVCSPISTLDCDDIAVDLPYSLTFDGTEGGLANTGFTMVDNPSARLAVDNPVYNANVPGFEPGNLNVTGGNLVITANNGIAFRTNGSGSNQSTEVNSQINTLGVGLDADAYGNFSINTTVVEPYDDATNNSEQAGIWFGLNEDNFVKLIANSNSQVELRSELNGLSGDADQVLVDVSGLNSSSVALRLYVDLVNNELVAFYALNGGLEVELGSLPIPAAYINGNSAYDQQTFAGVFATKRREESTTNITYTFEDFSIVPDNAPVAETIKINYSLAGVTPPQGYLVDSGLPFGDRGNGQTYGWLQTNGTTLLDLTSTSRDRAATSALGVLQRTLVHMQYGDVDSGVTPEGIWEMEVPNGSYQVSVTVGDPNIDGQAGTTPSHTINVEGVNLVDGYVPVGVQDSPGQFTSGSAMVNVTDGRLTIDANGGFNTKIVALEVTGSTVSGQPYFTNVTPADNATNVAINDFQINVELVVPSGYELDKTTLAGNVTLYEVTGSGEVLVPSNSNDTGGGDAITLTPLNNLKPFTDYIFRLSSGIEANLIGDLSDRMPFNAFESNFTTGDEESTVELDLSGVAFTPVNGTALGQGVDNQRFSSLVIGPDGKLYASTIGDFNSDGKIYRWDMALDGTLSNLEILSPELNGAPHPETAVNNNNDRLIIGLVFDPASTADNLIAYITHSMASTSDGPEWDGVISKLTGPDLETVEDLVIHLPRSKKDHLTNSLAFGPDGAMYLSQGSNTAGGEPDPAWDFRPERLLAGAVLKLELDKLPSSLPLSAYTTDNIGVINNAPTSSISMSDGTYNPYATNSPITIFATGVRNAYDLVWHSNGWLYVPTNGTAGNNSNSPNSPATSDYAMAKRIDGLTSIPSAPALQGGETQKDWLFKTQGGSYHGHPNPYRGEFVLNHGGISYSGLPGQEEASYTDVAKYPDNLQPDPNYREPAFDFGKNKSPNGVIEYQSNAFGGKLEGLLMVVRFSGQDDIIVLQPGSSGFIANSNGDVPGTGGLDDPLDVVEDPKTGNLYVSEYDRDNNGTPRLTLLRANVPAVLGPEIVATPEELIFEVTTNGQGDQTVTETVTISNEGTAELNISDVAITGAFANQFEGITPSGSATVAIGESMDFSVTYAPDLNNSNLGHQDAALTFSSDDPLNPTFDVGLHGLKKTGYEGGNEPYFQDVVDALGIGIDVGWNSLANPNTTNPALEGDEVLVQQWIKAGDEPVIITPVGRYSPAEELPFGWYTNDGNGNLGHNEVGILEGDLHNAQTLYPEVASGDTQFDPAGAVFGIYVESNTFNRFNYTEDEVNTGVAHRVRTYPMADREGNPIPNSYLVAFEDATNGDYQDYIFVLSNVEPFEDGTLRLAFAPETLDFMATIDQEDVPTKALTLAANGALTSAEVSLEASEDWLIVPTPDLNEPMAIGIDTEGLTIGTYVATLTATAPNYKDAVATISLDITNELVYTYQFNFQDPEAIAVSPAGYVDDLGAPYGVQATSQGNMSFGWVQPGTDTPASAAVNSRNRNTGVNDDPLLKTFNIIGHRTAADYPLLDWVADVPNGRYYINISVGDPDYTDSDHVLDVNGVTVLDYDQESDPNPSIFYESTELVDVTDGQIRLSLGAGGANAKPNYIRLAPYNEALVPPTLVASFEGTLNDTDVYRGAVSIGLEVVDNNGSGIVRFEYVLDGAPVQDYTEAISVSDLGAHTLVVTAEDGNGNVSEKTYEFEIEAATGAIMALENMTKIPGTTRGFPADDYYTFHRLGNPGSALVHDSNVMRVHNTGTGDLIISDVLISDLDDFEYVAMDESGASITAPFVVAPGSYVDLDITFIGTTGTGSNGMFKEGIEIVSNADNALVGNAVLHGGYSPQPEGGDEINAQEVFDAFGFQTSMLSIVNDEGTITPPNTITYSPSSNYPLAENIEAGYEGDLILTDAFVQADPSQPVIGIQLSALHGSGSNGASLRQLSGTGIVGGINFSHASAYYQTLLPKNGSGVINNDAANSISEPFRINVAGYYSTGSGGGSLLGVRVFPVIDHNGNVLPNEYLVVQDFIGNGCGVGSANCDWNDNTFYFINIRPQAVPTAQPIANILAAGGTEISQNVFEAFDKGYTGNRMTYTATYEGGSLPSWVVFNTLDGTLAGTIPGDATGSFTFDIEGVDLNGLTATTSLTIVVDEAPIAVDDEGITEQNQALVLSDLLANDSEPNGQDLTITSVSSPSNGTAALDEGVVTYTPETDFIGTDTFDYVVEDVNGLSDIATVTITVVEENQDPVAVIAATPESGQAALVVNFTGSGSTDDNGIVEFLWDFADGSTSNEADPEHIFTSAGVYVVTLTVTDGNGAQDAEQKTITVSSQPTLPTAVATANVLSGTAPLSVNFAADASTNAESYLWDFGGGNTATGATPTFQFAEPGIYPVSLTVTGPGGSDTAILEIVVREEGLVYELRINAGGPEVVHSGETYMEDDYFVGGKSYENADALVPELYQTERSASPPEFGYAIPVEDGDYLVTLHFAEIYWGATGGGTGDSDIRIFDVQLEGNTVLNDFDIYDEVGAETVVVRTFEVNVTDGELTMSFDANGSDGANQPKLSAIEIIGVPVNDAPVAVATSNVSSGEAPLTVAFTGSDSSDDKEVTGYSWTFGDGSSSTEMNPSHIYTVAGSYTATLTVVDAEGETHSDTVAITVEEPVVDPVDFALRINAGGGEVIHMGDTFMADAYFVGGKSYENADALVPELYQTERSASPPEFGYAIPVEDGDYLVTLHFAEIYWGANEGGTGNSNVRIFDVVLEGSTVLNDFDIYDEVGAETIVTRTYEVNVEDGELNMNFDALGGDGADQPKLSAIEIIGVPVNDAPIAVATSNVSSGEAPLTVAFTGSDSSDDNEVTGYSWTFGDGGSSTEMNPSHIYTVAGSYTATLTVVDAEGETHSDTVVITVEEPVVDPVDFALYYNTGSANTVSYQGHDFVGDETIAGQINSTHTYTNVEASSIPLFQTERGASANLATLSYAIPVPNGEYQVTTYHNELYWGKVNGTAGAGNRVFNIILEGNTVETEVDLFIENNNGPVQFTHTVLVDDGVLNIDMPATANMASISGIAIEGDINEAPVAVASSDITTGEAPLTVAFDGSGSSDDNGITSYAWDFGDGNTANTMSPSHTYTAAGSFTATLTVTDADGESNSDTVVVTVEEPVVVNVGPTAVAASNISNGESPLLVSFDGSGSSDDNGVVSYSWNFGDGSTGSGETASHTYTTAGVYTVSLTVTDGEGEQDVDDSLTITVEEPVVGPVDFALYYNTGSASTVSYEGHDFVGDESIADQINSDHTYANTEASSEPLFQTERGSAANLATLSYAIPVPNGTYTVSTYHNELYWGKSTSTSGEGLRVFDIEIEGNLEQSGFDIFVEAANGPIKFTFTTEVTDGELNIDMPASADRASISGIAIEGDINEAPVALASSDVTTGEAPLTVAFEGSGSSDDSGITSYAWDFGDGNTANTMSPSHTYTAAGSFTATLTVTDADGATNSDSIVIVVEETVVVDCGPLPAPWTNGDIGAVAAAGEACYADGTFTVEASGADIFGTVDEFHYVYQELSGDGEIVARLLSLEQVHQWSKAGVMMRNGTGANAAFAMMIFAPNPNGIGGPGYSFQHRTGTGAGMTGDNYTGPTLSSALPYYVRLVRIGDEFTGYVSTTNGNWTEVGSATIAMDETISVGLATTSHADGTLATAEYDNVDVLSVDGNTAPTAIAASNVTSGEAPLTVQFNGGASMDDMAVTNYSWNFGDDTAPVNEMTPSHTFNVPGTYQVTLTVSDAEGAQGTDVIDIVVEEPENLIEVESLTLIDATDDVEITNLVNGTVLNADVLDGLLLNIRANPGASGVGSIKFSLQGPLTRTWTESFAPYALYGDNSGDYAGVEFPIGTYALIATPYTGTSATGDVGKELFVIFSIVSEGIDKTGESETTTDVVLEVNPDMEMNMDPSLGLEILETKIFPNPATDYVYISTSKDDSISEIRLFDNNGRVVASFDPQKVMSSQGYELYVGNYHAGTYFVHVIDKAGNTNYFTLLIKR